MIDLAALPEATRQMSQGKAPEAAHRPMPVAAEKKVRIAREAVLEAVALEAKEHWCRLHLIP